MSTLSKVFVILVFIVALVKLGIDATLFAQKVDWKDKFVKEVNYHYQTQQVKNAEIAAYQVELDNRASMITILRDKIAVLDTELAGRSARLSDTQRQLDHSNSLLVKYEADQQVFVRQLEVQLAQIQEMTNKVEEFRQKLVKALNEKSTAVQELQYARQEAERLSKDLADLEDKHVGVAREKKRYEEILAHLQDLGVRTDIIGPKKPMEGKVQAVSTEIGLVVVSIGKDDGVLEGDEFTVYRGGNFVAKIVIDRVDSKWSAGKVVLKKDDPRVADDVSNHIFVSGTKDK